MPRARSERTDQKEKRKKILRPVQDLIFPILEDKKYESFIVI
jgi:hypothetical protein